MHITIKDPETGEIVGVVCIERTANSCQVLFCDIERLTELSNIAHALKVGEVRLITPAETREELESLGWKASPNLIVMVRRSDGK